MITDFEHSGLEHLFNTADWSRVSAPNIPKVRRILARLHRASIPADMDAPAFHLAPSRRAIPDCWSVTVGGPYLVVFRMEDGNATNVTLSANF